MWEGRQEDTECNDADRWNYSGGEVNILLHGCLFNSIRRLVAVSKTVIRAIIGWLNGVGPEEVLTYTKMQSHIFSFLTSSFLDSLGHFLETL